LVGSGWAAELAGAPRGTFWFDKALMVAVKKVAA